MDEEEDKSSVEYEKLAQEIYQALHNTEGFNTIQVKHNVKIPGKSGCKHQIDVYWEFKIAGETHRVAIECKNYSNCVSVGKVRDFFGVIHDIGNIKGIFVTKVGYQSGAKKFASYYGMSAKELRVPNAEDWKGRVKDIRYTVHLLMINVKDRQFDFNSDWVKQNTDIKENQPINIGARADQIIVVDKDGNTISSLYQLEEELPREPTDTQNLQKVVKYEHAYLKCPDLPVLKLNAIKFTYDTHTERITSISEGESIAKAILKDVTTGEVRFFRKDGDCRVPRTAKLD